MNTLTMTTRYIHLLAEWKQAELNRAMARALTMAPYINSMINLLKLQNHHAHLQLDYQPLLWVEPKKTNSLEALLRDCGFEDWLQKNELICHVAAHNNRPCLRISVKDDGACSDHVLDIMLSVNERD